MTIEQLLKLSVDDIANMSDRELEEHCRPFFHVTRPTVSFKERAAAARKQPKQTPKYQKKKDISKTLELAKQLGIDISGIK